MNGASNHRRGAVLILVVGMIAILAAIATAFLARSRGTSAVGEDTIRLAQTRIMLVAALTYIREASRLGYGVLEGDGDPARGDLLMVDPREGWGWIDTRVVVPNGGSRVGPNDVDGRPLYPVGWSPGPTRFDGWPAPGSVLRAPMYRLRRPPYAITQDYVRNPVPTDITKPTYGIPFLTNPDPIPQLPEGSYFDPSDPTPAGRTVVGGTSPHPLHDPLGSAARKRWAEGDRAPVPGTTDLAWFRIYRERIRPEQPGDPDGRLVSDDREINGIPEGAGICTFVITVGAGGTRGYRDWSEVVADGATGGFGGSRELFDEMRLREQRQWFRVGWSAAVGGGEDMIVMPAIEDSIRGPSRSHYQSGHINASRWRHPGGSDETIGQSQPRNYGGTISYIQRLDGPPSRSNW